MEPVAASSSCSAEFALLLACCRWPASEARSAAIIEQAGRGPDWARFGQIVARHRVEGLVHNALANVQLSVPIELKQQLAASAGEITRQNLRYAAESLRLKKSFGSAGIAFVFVKGVTLNKLAYGSLGIKGASDIDVVVEPSRYLEACQITEAAGFRRFWPGAEVATDQLLAWLERAKHTIWWSAQARVAVEVHASLVDSPKVLPALSVFSPQQQVEVGPGLFLPTLAKDELFAYLCVHGSAHAWSRLKWLADVAAFLKDDGPEEVERLYRRSLELGGGRAAAQALLLCSELLALPLRSSFKAELSSDSRTRYLVRIALKTMDRRGPVVELDQLVLGTVPIHLSHFFLMPGLSYKGSELRRKFLPARGGARGVGRLFSPLYRISTWLVSRAHKRRLGRNSGRS